MHANLSCPGLASFSRGLDEKRMMGPHSFGSSPAHSAQPSGQGGDTEESEVSCVGATASSKPSSIDRLGGK